jgi:predicted alpha/beta hydrolase family esterase
VNATVLIVPGLRNGGPAHWQSQWQRRHPECMRVPWEEGERLLASLFAQARARELQLAPAAGT